MLKNEKKIIELGKIWMKNSVNPNHNYEHASEVLKHSLNILKEFEGIDRSIVEIAVWWHDAYKSRQKRNTIYAVFFEGYESSKIFEKEMKELLDVDSIQLISKAIFNHNTPPVILNILGRYDTLTQILIEADNLDSMSLSRYHNVHKSFPDWLIYVIVRMYKVYIEISCIGVRKSMYYINNFRIF